MKEMSISVTRRRETRPNHIRKSRSDRVFDAVIYTAAALLTLIALYPMYFIVIASVSDPNLVARGDVLLWPRGVSLEGYSYLFSMSNLWTGYGNTVLYTLAGTLIMLIVNIPVAYALSRKDLPGRGFFTFYFIFPMFFGGGLIPTFIILNNTFHLVDTFLVMVLPFSVISYYIVVARTFFQTSLPAELWDAAQIDGCGNLRYFFGIVLPLSKAILAVSFGTAYAETRKKTIEAVEADLAAAFPERKLYTAWTSGMILRKLRARGEEARDTLA